MYLIHCCVLEQRSAPVYIAVDINVTFHFVCPQNKYQNSFQSFFYLKHAGTHKKMPRLYFKLKIMYRVGKFRCLYNLLTRWLPSYILDILGGAGKTDSRRLFQSSETLWNQMCLLDGEVETLIQRDRRYGFCPLEYVP